MKSQTTLALVVLATVAADACFAGGGGPRPNVLFVLIDDLGHGDLSCTGNRDVRTANIDRLAREGTRFTQFYVASPICSPSRVGLTTGQHPARWRIHSFLSSREANRRREMADFLDPQAPAIARAFQQAGYATAHFGKWHMGGGRDVGEAPLPQAYGFDRSLTSFEGLGDRLLIRRHGLSEQSAKLGRGEVRWVEKHEMTRIYVDRAARFIKEQQGRPFYAHVWLNDVHDPFHPSAEQLARHSGKGRNAEERKFFAVLDETDRQLGRLFAAVDELSLAESTLIVVASDNGPTAWPRYYKRGIAPPGSTAGDRGRKWSLYEGGIRMPLIVRWKGRVPAGRVDETTVIAAVDYFPTVCRLAGVRPPDGVDFDGREMSEAWLGKPVERRDPLFWEYPRSTTDLKPGLPEDRSPPLAVRDGDWKLLMNPDGTGAELYDLATDRKESKNLAAARPEVTARLSKRLLDWRKTLP